MSAAIQPAAASVTVSLVEVTIDEALNLSAVPKVSAQLDKILAVGPRHVVIDLSRCPLVDAAAIALLLDVHRRLWRAGGQLSLRSLPPRLLRLLQVARVDQVLNIVPAASPAGPARSAPPGSGSEPADSLPDPSATARGRVSVPSGVLAPLAADPPDAA